RAVRDLLSGRRGVADEVAVGRNSGGRSGEIPAGRNSGIQEISEGEARAEAEVPVAVEQRAPAVAVEAGTEREVGLEPEAEPLQEVVVRAAAEAEHEGAGGRAVEEHVAADAGARERHERDRQQLLEREHDERPHLQVAAAVAADVASEEAEGV